MSTEAKSALKTIRVKKEDYDKAAAFLDDNLRLDGKDKTTCLMLCEEMILRLLHAGNNTLTLSVKGGFAPRVMITAELPMDALRDDACRNEEERLEAEIRRDILVQYGAYIDREQKDGQTVYRIYPRPRGGEVFKEELFGFYSGERPGNLAKPTGVLRCIAAKHPAMVGFSVLNRTVKHVCALMLPVFAAGMIDTLSTCESFFDAPVLLNIFGAALALLVNLICATVDARVWQRFVRGVESGFRMAIIQKIQILSMDYYSHTPSGKILSKLVSDVQFIKLLLCEQMQTVLHLGIDIVFVAVMSLIRLPIMLAFYAVVIPASALIIRRYMPPISASKANMRSKTEVVNASFKEMLAMENLSRAHGTEKAQIQRLSPGVCSVESAAIEQDRLQVRLNNAGYATAQGFRLLCVCVAVFLALRGRITVASVVLFSSLFDALNNTVQKFLDDIPQITQELDSLTSVDELLGEKDTERNGSVPLPLPVRGEIRFEDVSFTYAPEQPPVLRGVNLEIPAGSCVAFVGKSGAGKSTILSLILGLHSPQSGKITVDGENLDELDKTRYRQHVAVVPQSSTLFTGTLWDNLTYGLKYVSEERVTRVLESVGLMELVSAHPEGLFRPILEGGENLSGGQRQRISIARALLREPSLILFDEATSALDSESEREVQSAIEAIIGRCTVVMVAHRLNTIQKADIIYQIRDGHVAPCTCVDEYGS